MAARGGGQRIPRPPGARPGGPPPWSHVPADRRRLSLAQVRERCAALPPPQPPPFEMPGSRPAAVLVPLFDLNGEAHVILTKRPDTMPSHQGEISFPGGGLRPRVDAGLQDAALREAEEEIGLPPRAVELVGALQPTPTIATNYAVYPFVGLIEPGHEWRPSANEVAEVMEVPLRALRAGYERRRLMRRGVPFRTDVYVIGEDVIWGATARMVGDLLDRLPDDLA